MQQEFIHVPLSDARRVSGEVDCVGAILRNAPSSPPASASPSSPSPGVGRNTVPPANLPGLGVLSLLLSRVRPHPMHLIFAGWWGVQWEGGGKVPGSFFRLIRRYGWEGECGGTRRHTSGHPSCLPPRLSLALFLSLSLLGLHLCKTLTSLCQSLDAFLVAIGVPPEVLPLCPPSTPQIWWHLQRGERSKEQVG